MREFRPAAQVLSADPYEGLLAMNQTRKRDRPKAEVTKEHITIRRGLLDTH